MAMQVSVLPVALQKPRLRRWEASDYLRLVHGVPASPATLAKWASIGGGPKFQKLNHMPLYPTDELDAWAIRKLGYPVSNTTEAGIRET